MLRRLAAAAVAPRRLPRRLCSAALQAHHSFYIDGEWVPPVEGVKPHQVINPATEQPIATIALGSPADVDAAVRAAQRALPSWSATSREERLAMLEKLAAIYAERQGEVAQAISAEMGAPIRLATRAQAAAGLAHLRQFVRVLRGFEFEQPLRAGELLTHEPIGVCALIAPWNWPMNQVSLKVAPALAAGCTALLKPSEVAPLSSLLFAEMVHQAGFPPGVFNLVQGEGAVVGEAMATHPAVDLVSFTGSARGGRAVTRAAAEGVKRVVLELGGKGPNLVFADLGADLATAVRRGVRHCFQNSGQSCNAPTRMLVERSVYAEAEAVARAEAEAQAVADPALPGTHIGPLASAAQWHKVQGLIAEGVASGARLVSGGLGRPDGLGRGYYARPTLFADVPPHAAIWREEIFGPVLCLAPFDSEAEAIALANDSAYGLTSYVQTADAARARRVSRALRAGMVEVNGKACSAGAPFGGVRQSGNGREGGEMGLREFLEVKTIAGWPS